MGKLENHDDLPVDWRNLLLKVLEKAQVSDATEELVLKTVRSVLDSSPAKKEHYQQPLWDLGEEHIEKLNTTDVSLIPVDSEKIQVPRLSYGLDRVLFNQGVYQLQDPRTRVFNFDPYLREIMPVTQFDFGALSQYITSSRDQFLLAKAAECDKKYVGSTSSMSSTLIHFHFLLSNWRPIEYGNLSGTIPKRLKICTYTMFTRAPTAIFLRYRKNSYAIDADKEFDDSNILSMLGKSMEKLLTLPTERFEKYRRQNSDQLTKEERNERESYHYTTFGDFLLRSQLDAYDPRLPGTGMFDLKTRCVISVRMDVSEYESSKSYEIRKTRGEWESYEREYYDMIRAAFLKYSMQVRMGRMDGIFVAFHNTARIFGFQYISLEEMDYAIHGTENLTIGDEEFKLSLSLLNQIFDRVTARFPQKSIRFFFETPSQKTEELAHMKIIAQPMEEEEVESIQAKAKEKIEKFEKKVLGIGNHESDEEESAVKQDLYGLNCIEKSLEQGILKDITEGEVIDEDAAPEEQLATNIENIKLSENKVDRSYDVNSSATESLEVECSDFVIEDENSVKITGQNGDDEQPLQDEFSKEKNTENILDKKIDSETLQNSEKFSESSEVEKDDNTEKNNLSSDQKVMDKDKVTTEDCYSKPFMALKLIIRNKVNGIYVTRPENLRKGDDWSIEYQLAEYPEGKESIQVYREVKKRRESVHSGGLDMDPNKPPSNLLVRELRKYIEKGRQHRKRETEIESKLPVHVVGSE